MTTLDTLLDWLENTPWQIPDSNLADAVKAWNDAGCPRPIKASRWASDDKHAPAGVYVDVRGVDSVDMMRRVPTFDCPLMLIAPGGRRYSITLEDDGALRVAPGSSGRGILMCAAGSGGMRGMRLYEERSPMWIGADHAARDNPGDGGVETVVQMPPKPCGRDGCDDFVPEKLRDIGEFCSTLCLLSFYRDALDPALDPEPTPGV